MTLAPSSSNVFLIFSASAFGTSSFITFGTDSANFLAWTSQASEQRGCRAKEKSNARQTINKINGQRSFDLTSTKLIPGTIFLISLITFALASAAKLSSLIENMVFSGVFSAGASAAAGAAAAGAGAAAAATGMAISEMFRRVWAQKKLRLNRVSELKGNKLSKNNPRFPRCPEV